MRRLLFALVIALTVVNAGAQSEDRKASREREMARRLQGQVQKLESENARLQQQSAELLQQQQVDLARNAKASASLSRRLRDAKQREETSTRELQELKDTLAQAQTKLAEQQALRAATSERLDAATKEQQRLTAELRQAQEQLERQRDIIARQSVSLQDVTDRNLKLYRLNSELLDRYNDKGVWDALLQREPLTQIKDVQAQAIVQEYRDRLDELKLERPDVGR
ncbi:MAG: hypothetical protein ABI794_04490 [Betaproteobacteria bacterium]